MKSILQENKQFRLEERFILNEETLLEAQATLKQLLIDLNAIETNCKELLKFLPTGITFDVPAELGISDPELLKIQGGCADVQELLEANGRFGKLIDKIREKAKDSDNSFTEDEIKVLEPLCYTIASDINSIKDCLKNMTNKKGDIKQQVSVLRERAPRLAQNIKKLYDADTKKARDDRHKTTDWSVKLASTTNKDAVIRQFIYATWPKKSDLVIKIKSALLQECETYGFIEAKNPFITFITNYYLNENFKITYIAYNVIHNLVVNGILSIADLSGQGPLKKGNLIFCKALYDLDPGAIKLYLKKQNTLLRVKRTESCPFNSNERLTFNLLYKITINPKEQGIQESAALTLRPMTEIEQLEAKWTVLDAESAPTTSTEVINQIQTRDTAIKVLAALALKFSTNEEIIRAITASSEVKQYMATPSSITDTQKLIALVERTYKLANIKAEAALELIKNLIDHFELSKG